MQYVYSFRISVELEPVARSYGFTNVSEFVRDAVFYYIRNIRLNSIENEAMVKLSRIEELYKRYVFLKRMLGTDREIKRLMAISLSDSDVSTEVVKSMVNMLNEKKELEKQVLELLLRSWSINDRGDDVND